MTTSPTYEFLLAACQKPGCPFCRVTHDVEYRYLDQFFYSQVNDYNSRVRFRASTGFCPQHAEMSMNELAGKSLGLAILYEDLLRIAQENLEKGQNLAQAKGKCPACQLHDETDGYLLMDLERYLLQPELETALKGSAGLCFSHFSQAYDRLRGDKRRQLVTIQLQAVQALRGELAEFIRKNDYRFQAEGFGAERDSWRRGVGQVTSVWPRDEK
jgi:hypothetical protein